MGPPDCEIEFIGGPCDQLREYRPDDWQPGEVIVRCGYWGEAHYRMAEPDKQTGGNHVIRYEYVEG